MNHIDKWFLTVIIGTSIYLMLKSFLVSRREKRGKKVEKIVITKGDQTEEVDKGIVIQIKRDGKKSNLGIAFVGYRNDKERATDLADAMCGFNALVEEGIASKGMKKC